MGKSAHIYKVLFISLLLIVFNNSKTVFAQQTIGGVINSYTSVTSISGTASVIVSDVTNFADGDTVLLIQMQGVKIYVADDGSYGTYYGSLGTPGAYEFIIIQSINTGTKEVTFKSDLIKSYNVLGNVQMVSVPSFNHVTVNTTLTSQPWDDPANPKAGGVVTLIARGNLKLDADIDVSGKGFKGGGITTGTGICVDTDPGVLGLYSYDNVSPNAGYKG